MKKQKRGCPLQRSLFFKYFTLCFSMILLSTVLLGAIHTILSAYYFEQEQYQNISTSLDRIAEYTEKHSFFDPTDNSLKFDSNVEDVYGLFEKSNNTHLLLFDPNGDVLLVSTSLKQIEEYDTPLSPSVLSVLETEGTYQMTEHFGSNLPYWYVVAKPLVVQEQTAGYLIIARFSDFLEHYFPKQEKIFLSAMVIMLALSTLILFCFVSRMVKPLQEMAKVAHAYGRGDFSVKIHSKRKDEIGQLAVAFNTMSSDLALLEDSRKSFTANVSHELKTPMTSIAGFVDGILDGTIPAKDEKKYLRIVSKEIQRLAKLVHSMLNLSRIEAGEISLEYSSVSVDALILSILLTFENRIKEKQLQITGLDDINICLNVDSDLIYQVLYNLIENAVKFVNVGGEIRFSFSNSPTEVQISIYNTGEGLTEEERLRIFNRFYKTDASRSLDRTGVGLGLNIVQKIMYLHDGTVEVESEKGKYTQFQVTFPKEKHE